MKKQMIMAAVCGTLLMGGGLAAEAQQRGVRGGELDGPHQGRFMCARGGSMQAPRLQMYERLDLSEAQQKEVQKLLADSREQTTKLHAKVREIRRQLRQAMDPNKFNEKAVRKLAAEKSAIQTDLMVDRAKTHSRIYALLTPEQKELADLAGKLRRLQGHGRMNAERPMKRAMPTESMNKGGSN
jgi:protein CpxP